MRGHIKLSVRVSQKTLKSGILNRFLTIVIYDTGLGIKQKDLKNLFKLFGKLDDPD
jgi:signal transduction histidine kinase